MIAYTPEAMFLDTALSLPGRFKLSLAAEWLVSGMLWGPVYAVPPNWECFYKSSHCKWMELAVTDYLWKNSQISEGLIHFFRMSQNTSMVVTPFPCYPLGVLSEVWGLHKWVTVSKVCQSTSGYNLGSITCLERSIECKMSEITGVLLLCQIRTLILSNHSLLRTHYFL